MVKKRICNVLAIIFLGCVCIGCTKKNIGSTNASSTTAASANAEKPIIVGFSQIGAESAWRTCNTENIKAAAKKSGIQLIYSNAEQKKENQIKAIRSFIVYQVDAIVFVPIVQDGWDNILTEAKEAGIPVIIVDRKITTSDPSLYAGYIGTDSIAEGEKAARFLVNHYNPNEENIHILEVRGTDGSSASDGRYKGFRNYISSDKRFSIVYSESGDFLKSRGKEIAENLLRDKNSAIKNNKLYVNNEKIDVLFSYNDGMVLGFLEALEKTSIRPGKDITIVSIDAEQAAIDKLLEGKINCIVECNPKIGDLVMESVLNLLKGKTIPFETHVEETVFFSRKSPMVIEPRGY